MNDRQAQLCALADYDPVKITELERTPIINYYMLLNARIEMARKSNKGNKK